MTLRQSPILVVLCLLATTPLAGCMGDGSSEQDASATPTDVPTNEVRNAVEGQVTGIDLLPIEGVRVEILSLNATVFTNTEGRYRFVNLEPRDYLLTATHDAYRTVTQRAIVQDETIFELDFVLEERPLIEPYHQTLDQTGRIGCKIVYGTDPESMEHVDCASAVPEDPSTNKDKLDFVIPAGPAQIVVEAFWEHGTEAAKHLTMTVESVGFGHQDLTFGQMVGPDGIKIAVARATTEKYYTDGGTLRVRMDAGPSITGEEAGIDFGMAVQQEFVVFVTIFYVDVGPVNFTARPGA